MKIVCTTLNAKYIHTNLAIRYLKAYARPQFDIDIVEYTIKDPVLNIVTDLIKRNPDVVGFSCYIWNIEDSIKIIKLIKKINPSVQTVFGGPEVSYDAPDWLERIPELDFIISGEGEKAFKDLLYALNGEKSLREVGGLAYRENGEIRFNPQTEKLDLSAMPSPFRFEEDLPHLPKRITYIETSRGCPFTCQFCLSSIESGVRYFDMDKIKDDLRYLMKNGAKTIKFMDRTFNINRKYAMDIFRFLIEEHTPGTVFQFEITADIMKPDIIEFLNKEAPPGLFRFEIGVQSTNEHTNQLIKRRQDFGKLSRIVKMIKEGGKIAQHLDLIAGLPKEDYNSFRKTFNDVFALKPEELQLGFLKMLRGTGLRRDAGKYGYVYMDHPPYEILSNDVLSFHDIIKIKQAEDILEKYWNKHRMDHTIEFLTTHIFTSAFDFFQEFGAHWEDSGWPKIGYQPEDLFERLYSFLKTKKIADLDVVLALMQMDFLKKAKYKPRKVWWETNVSKKEKSAFYRKLLDNPLLLGEKFAGLELTERDLYKYTITEKIPFNLEKYLSTGTVEREPSFMVVHFHPAEERAMFFSCTVEEYNNI